MNWILFIPSMAIFLAAIGAIFYLYLLPRAPMRLQETELREEPE